MYFLNKSAKEWKSYKKMLEEICSLSNLFSDSSVPYLYYRVHENIFCKAFNAENLSRSDCSADAKKNTVGVGLKTFLNGNGKTMQKIAEFNKEREAYRDMISEKLSRDLAVKIAEMRNKRIEFTMRNYSIDKMIYHCTARSEGVLELFEENMDKIAIENIKVTKADKKTIHFNDGIHEYSFNETKSTLFKRFITKNSVKIPVEIIEDPFSKISSIFDRDIRGAAEPSISYIHPLSAPRDFSYGRVYLPLYSTKTGAVPEKSGLNQWNAGGRKRDIGEVYIPVPSWIHKNFESFFPSRDVKFSLHLPNGKVISAKLCQAGSKALMSDPNKALGQWILRDVFNLKEGELLTDEILKEVGVDSVGIIKLDEYNYQIDFAETGSYQDFEDEYKIS